MTDDRHDGDRHDRVIDVSVEVPGTPEEVWAAVATGPGISSWFVPHRFAEEEGATVTMDWGPYGVDDTSTLAAYEPPHRFVIQGGGDMVLAYEWLVEARTGGTCVVRLVNSGFGHGAEWDAEYDGMTEGWPLFLRNLRLHLTHFAGQQARCIQPVGALPGPNAAAFVGLCERLGTSPDLGPGDRLSTAGDGVPALTATVEDVRRGERSTDYLLLVDGPHPGTAFIAAEGADADRVVVSTYLYLYGDVPDDVEAAWYRFFADRTDPAFPPAADADAGADAAAH